MTADAKRANDGALIEGLAAVAQDLGATRLSLSISDRCVAALLNAGAARVRRAIRYDDEKLYVIETATLQLAGLVIEAHRPVRPASLGEARALETNEAYYYLGTYKTVEMTNVD